jgi:Uma2 family endonuclease
MAATVIDVVVPPAIGTGTLKQTVWIAEHRAFQVPGWVHDLASFRRWAHSDAFPEKTRICYFAREVWVDLTPEQGFSHNRVKTVVAVILKPLVDASDIGLFFSDGMRVSNLTADLSSEPDAMFLAYPTLEAGRVRLVEGKNDGYVEVEGTPDMVLEVVSDSSEVKDLQTLRDLYWRAGIEEYWLMDARGESLVFEILHHGSKGYTARRKQGGWVKSSVFGKSFQLRRELGKLGHPKFTLAVK